MSATTSHLQATAETFAAKVRTIKDSGSHTVFAAFSETVKNRINQSALSDDDYELLQVLESDEGYLLDDESAVVFLLRYANGVEMIVAADYSTETTVEVMV